MFNAGCGGGIPSRSNLASFRARLSLTETLNTIETQPRTAVAIAPASQNAPTLLMYLANGLIGAALRAHARFFTRLNFLQLDTHNR